MPMVMVGCCKRMKRRQQVFLDARSVTADSRNREHERRVRLGLNLWKFLEGPRKLEAPKSCKDQIDCPCS